MSNSKIFNFQIIKKIPHKDVYKVSSPINQKSETKILKILDADNYQELNELILCMLLKHSSILSYSEIHTPNKSSESKSLSKYAFSILFECGSPTYVIRDNNKIKQYFYQILCAVDYLHQQGFIHGDLKSANIIIFNDGVKLIDFGLSVLHDTDVKRNHSHLLYTWFNRPPELIDEPEQPISTAFDVWALGMTFFEMLGGLNILISKKGKISELYKKINCEEFYSKDHKEIHDLWLNGKLNSIIKDILQKRTNIPQDLVDIIMLMLTVDHTKRPTIKEIMNHRYFKDVKCDPYQDDPYQDDIYQDDIYQDDTIKNVELCTDINFKLLLVKLLTVIRKYKKFLQLTPKQGILALDILYQLVEYTYYQPNIKNLVDKNIIIDSVIYLAKSLSGDICSSDTKITSLLFNFIIDKKGCIYRRNIGTYSRSIRDIYHAYDIMLNRCDEYLLLMTNTENINKWLSNQEQILICRFTLSPNKTIKSYNKAFTNAKQIVKLL